MDIAKYIGLPYADKGESPDIGFDCYGLCRYLHKEIFDNDLPTYGIHYASSEDSTQVEYAIDFGSNDGNWKEVAFDALDYGTLLFFNVVGKLSHVGFYLGDGYFIHILPGRNTCIENLSDIAWSRRFHKALKWNP